MTSLRRGDRDLHDENGEHVSTPPTADGHQLELYEARIRRHLEAHKADAWAHAGWAEGFAQDESSDPAAVDNTAGRMES